ncbi:MAG: ABC transporter permease subunit [Clostridia bacterium]|nr:ABC transporter permease subunit [Clostridia bacterium]
MLAIYKKEMRSYFINPVGYVFIGVFLALSAALCCYTTLQSNSYSTASYYYWLILSMIIIIPLLTMRTFSEERKMRTEQMLMTAPISITGMVMGKFLAAMTIYAGCLAASCVNLIPLYVMGKRESNPDEGVVAGPVTPEVVGSLLGVLLIGAVFIAIGILISSMTENQLSAAVITIAVLAVMLVLNMLNGVGSEEEGTRLINNYVVRYIIDWISVVSRFTNFQYGILDWSALLYYVSMTFIAIYLTVRVYERRRWA